MNHTRFLSLTLCTLALTAGSLLAEDTATPAPAASTETAKHPKAREEMLKRFDANGDGKLDETERAAARAAHPKAGKKAEQRLLERFDANKDGKLDETEMAAAKKWREEHAGKAGKKNKAGAAEPMAETETKS